MEQTTAGCSLAALCAAREVPEDHTNRVAREMLLIARRLVRNRVRGQDRDDVVQEAMLRMVRAGAMHTQRDARPALMLAIQWAVGSFYRLRGKHLPVLSLSTVHEPEWAKLTDRVVLGDLDSVLLRLHPAQRRVVMAMLGGARTKLQIATEAGVRAKDVCQILKRIE